MKINPDVMAVLSVLDVNTGPAPAGSSTVITMQLDRKLYVKVNEVLEALGGKWSRKAKAHLFEDTAATTRERIDDAIVRGDVETDKDLGFFPTPPALARDIVRTLSVGDGAWVLEPSAGDGRIVHALLDLTPASVLAVELDAARAWRCGTMLREWRTSPAGPAMERGTWLAGDFLDQSFGALTAHVPSGFVGFDAVVMNPPFVRGPLGDHLDHVRHAFGMLRPEGTLVAILPAGVKFRQDRRHREFREWFEQWGGTLRELQPLTFRESGTDVQTVVLRMSRC